MRTPRKCFRYTTEEERKAGRKISDRRWKENHKELQSLRIKVWQKANPDKIIIARRIREPRTRLKAITALGGKCIRCGATDIRCLQIDHINGGGTKERKRGCLVIFNKILQDIEKAGESYQVLCANCNIIKQVENREYGRKVRNVSIINEMAQEKLT